jgi:hypothetical protein
MSIFSSDTNQKTPIVATTQDHLSIEDIKNNFVILKNGNVCIVIETSAVNFYLLSEVEQNSKIYAFAGLLNSLGFYIQVMIHTENIDISSYLKHIDEYKAKQKDPKIKYQIDIYRKFVKDLIVKNNVLDKHFYVVVPYMTFMPKQPSFISRFTNKNEASFDVDNMINQATSRLIPRRDHLIRQLSRMGLKAKQLDNSELIKLFYNIYNPMNAKIREGFDEYTKPIVSYQ